MLRCKDNTIYSGYTVDITKRIETHNSGKGAKYTRARRPVKLVYYEEFDTKTEALKREREFKKYTHQEKENIISQNKKESVRKLKWTIESFFKNNAFFFIQFLYHIFIYKQTIYNFRKLFSYFYKIRRKKT